MNNSFALLISLFLQISSLFAQDLEKQIVGKWRLDPGSIDNQVSQVVDFPPAHTPEVYMDGNIKIRMAEEFKNQVIEFLKDGKVLVNGKFDEALPLNWRIVKDDKEKTYLERIELGKNGEDLITRQSILEFTKEKMGLMDPRSHLKIEYLRVKD